jgi:uncharacterized protein (DUF2141 family)
MLFVAAALPFNGFSGEPDSAANMGSIDVRIDGFQNNKGTVKIALVNSKESYDSHNDIFRGAREPVKDKTCSYVFTDIPYGDYALKIFHDENNNDNMDTNFLGVPKEAYGFSNNVRARFGPPDYEKAVFTLSQDTLIIEVTVK